MNVFFKKYKNHKNILLQLNRCRISLQVLTTLEKLGKQVNEQRLIFNKTTGTSICPPREAMAVSLTLESKHTWIFDTGAQAPTLTADLPERVRLTNDIIYNRIQGPNKRNQCFV